MFANFLRLLAFWFVGMLASVTLVSKGYRKISVILIPEKGWGRWATGFSPGKGFFAVRQWVTDHCGGGCCFGARKNQVPKWAQWLVVESDTVWVCLGLYSQATTDFVVEHEIAHSNLRHLDGIKMSPDLDKFLSIGCQEFEIEADLMAAERVGYSQAYFALVEMTQSMCERDNLSHTEKTKIMADLQERKLAVLKEWAIKTEKKLAALPQQRKIPILC
jgi:hypothetical protein